MNEELKKRQQTAQRLSRLKTSIENERARAEPKKLQTKELLKPPVKIVNTPVKSHTNASQKKTTHLIHEMANKKPFNVSEVYSAFQKSTPTKTCFLNVDSYSFQDQDETLAKMEYTSYKLNEIASRVNQVLETHEEFSQSKSAIDVFEESDNEKLSSLWNDESLIEQSKNKVKVLLVDADKLNMDKSQVLESLKTWFKEISHSTIEDLEESILQNKDSSIDDILSHAYETKDALRNIHEEIVEYFQKRAVTAETNLQKESTSSASIERDNLIRINEDRQKMIDRLQKRLDDSEVRYHIAVKNFARDGMSGTKIDTVAKRSSSEFRDNEIVLKSEIEYLKHKLEKKQFLESKATTKFALSSSVPEEQIQATILEDKKANSSEKSKQSSKEYEAKIMQLVKKLDETSLKKQSLKKKLIEKESEKQTAVDELSMQHNSVLKKTRDENAKKISELEKKTQKMLDDQMKQFSNAIENKEQKSLFLELSKTFESRLEEATKIKQGELDEKFRNEQSVFKAKEKELNMKLRDLTERNKKLMNERSYAKEDAREKEFFKEKEFRHPNAINEDIPKTSEGETSAFALFVDKSNATQEQRKSQINLIRERNNEKLTYLKTKTIDDLNNASKSSLLLSEVIPSDSTKTNRSSLLKEFTKENVSESFVAINQLSLRKESEKSLILDTQTEQRKRIFGRIKDEFKETDKTGFYEAVTTENDEKREMNRLRSELEILFEHQKFIEETQLKPPAMKIIEEIVLKANETMFEEEKADNDDRKNIERKKSEIIQRIRTGQVIESDMKILKKITEKQNSFSVRLNKEKEQNLYESMQKLNRISEANERIAKESKENKLTKENTHLTDFDVKLKSIQNLTSTATNNEGNQHSAPLAIISEKISSQVPILLQRIDILEAENEYLRGFERVAKEMVKSEEFAAATTLMRENVKGISATDFVSQSEEKVNEMNAHFALINQLSANGPENEVETKAVLIEAHKSQHQIVMEMMDIVTAQKKWNAEQTKQMGNKLQALESENEDLKRKLDFMEVKQEFLSQSSFEDFCEDSEDETEITSENEEALNQDFDNDEVEQMKSIDTSKKAKMILKERKEVKGERKEVEGERKEVEGERKEVQRETKKVKGITKKVREIKESNKVLQKQLNNYRELESVLKEKDELIRTLTIEAKNVNKSERELLQMEQINALEDTVNALQHSLDSKEQTLRTELENTIESIRASNDALMSEIVSNCEQRVQMLTQAMTESVEDESVIEALRKDNEKRIENAIKLERSKNESYSMDLFLHKRKTEEEIERVKRSCDIETTQYHQLINRTAIKLKEMSTNTEITQQTKKSLMELHEQLMKKENGETEPKSIGNTLKLNSTQIGRSFRSIKDVERKKTEMNLREELINNKSVVIQQQHKIEISVTEKEELVKKTKQQNILIGELKKEIQRISTEFQQKEHTRKSEVQSLDEKIKLCEVEIDSLKFRNQILEKTARETTTLMNTIERNDTQQRIGTMPIEGTSDSVVELGIIHGETIPADKLEKMELALMSIDSDKSKQNPNFFRKKELALALLNEDKRLRQQKVAVTFLKLREIFKQRELQQRMNALQPNDKMNSVLERMRQRHEYSVKEWERRKQQLVEARKRQLMGIVKVFSDLVVHNVFPFRVEQKRRTVANVGTTQKKIEHIPTQPLQTKPQEPIFEPIYVSNEIDPYQRRIAPVGHLEPLLGKIKPDVVFGIRGKNVPTQQQRMPKDSFSVKQINLSEVPQQPDTAAWTTPRTISLKTASQSEIPNRGSSSSLTKPFSATTQTSKGKSVVFSDTLFLPPTGKL